jgi:hypothetical protein
MAPNSTHTECRDATCPNDNNVYYNGACVCKSGYYGTPSNCKECPIAGNQGGKSQPGNNAVEKKCYVEGNDIVKDHKGTYLVKDGTDKKYWCPKGDISSDCRNFSIGIGGPAIGIGGGVVSTPGG